MGQRWWTGGVFNLEWKDFMTSVAVTQEQGWCGSAPHPPRSEHGSGDRVPLASKPQQVVGSNPNQTSYEWHMRIPARGR